MELLEKSNELKQAEENHFKKAAESDKLHALIEQKMNLTENELREYKQKYLQKDLDLKELGKDLTKTRKELQVLTSKLHQ